MFNADDIKKIRQSIDSGQTYVSKVNKTSPVLPKAPKALPRLGKAFSSIGKGMAATPFLLGQVTAQSTKDTINQFQDEDFRTARMNQAIAQTDPALTEARFNQSRYGTPLPINKNLQTTTQNLQNAQISTPIDLNSIGGRLMQSSNEDWQQATGDLGGKAQFLANTGRSIVENVATLPLATINPSLPLAAMGARSAASKAYELSQQGIGASEALSRGLVSGGIEALTEKIPLENVLKLGKEGSKQIIKSLLKQSGIEATEESASYALNYLADKAYKDPNASFSIKELALSAAGGALSGGVMGGGAMAFNKVANRQPSLPQATKQSPSLPRIQSQAIVNEQVKKSNNEAISPTQDATIELPQQVKPMQPIQSVEPIVESTPVESKIIGKGNMGDVIKDGDYAYKNANRKDGKATIEGEVYKALKGNDNILNGELVNYKGEEKIKTPYSKNIVSIDTIPKEKRASIGKNIIAKDVDGIIDAINALSNAGYSYSDPLQFAYVDDKLKLMDFSNSSKRESKAEAISDNYSSLNLFLSSFGLDGYGETISKGMYLKYLSEDTTIEDLRNGEHLIPKEEIPIIKQIVSSGVKPNNVYYSRNLRAVQTKMPVGQTEVNGLNYVFSDKPLSAKDIDEWELSKIYESEPTTKANQQAPNLPLARPQDGTLPQATNNNVPTQPQPITGQNEASYDGLIDEYGAIPKGEKAFREVDVPKQTQPDNRTSRFVRTALEAEATPDAMVEPIKDAIEQDAFAYEPIKDAKAMSYATDTIKNKTYDGALKQWQGLVESNSFPSKEDIVLGEMLYKEAAQAGDTKTAMRTLAEVAALGTRLGQGVQALRSLKKMTPDGQLYYIQKSVDHINEDIKRRHNGKAQSVKINEQLVEEFLKAETQEAREAVADKINKDVGEQVPVTWIDKWNAWRYLAMLGNPRTHIRNIVGNSVFIPARKFKNLIGAGLEKALPQNQRTKAILTPEDKSLIDFARTDFNKNADSITRGGKYNPADAIRENRKMFDNKILEFLRKINFSALEKEDIWFLRGAYESSMAGWMKAQGKTADTISQAELGSARNYATQEALKATYRDASKMATALSRASKTSKGANLIIEGIIPFKKTPINILKRGIEYSPVGVFKSVYDMRTQVKKGNMTATDAIDELAAGLSGSAIMALGAYLASQGWVTGGGEDDKREANFDKLQGVQNYALKIGDISYTIDWTAPVALPLFVGVETYNAFKADNKTSGFTEFADGLTRITEPMFNLSMLQGVSSTIQSAVYAKRNPLPEMGINVASNYIGQANPTLLGQIARTIDDTRRNAYYNDKTVDLPQVAQIAIKRNLAKIPVASKNLPAYIDQWGREEKTPNFTRRAVENFLSPGYISEDKSTPVDKELKKIYDRTGEISILPNTAPKYFNVGEKRIDLNAKQYVTYAKEKGQKSYEYVNSLINNKNFKRLSDENKVKVIEDAYGIANSIAKTKVSLYKMDSTAQKALQATRTGISMGEYLVIKNTANIDGQGSIRQEEAQEVLDKTNLTNKQKSAVWKTFNSSWKFNPYE